MAKEASIGKREERWLDLGRYEELAVDVAQADLWLRNAIKMVEESRQRLDDLRAKMAEATQYPTKYRHSGPLAA